MKWTPKIYPEWQPWFAWHPVKIGPQWVWWEWVERKFYSGAMGDGIFDYRLPVLSFGCTAEDIDEINY